MEQILYRVVGIYIVSKYQYVLFFEVSYILFFLFFSNKSEDDTEDQSRAETNTQYIFT